MTANTNTNTNTDTIPSSRKQLRRRRSRLLEPEEGTEVPQEQQQEQEQQQPENVHCRGTKEGVSESGWEPVVSELSLESIATEEYLLGPLLNASGVDFCRHEPVDKFRYPHFRQVPTTLLLPQPQDSHSNSNSNSNSTQLSIHPWEVNCCVIPQEPNMTYFEGIPDYYNFAVGQMFVSSWAAFFSLATILAMTLPLLKKKKRSRASTYNLYLVFLAIPDLIYNVFLLYLFARYQNYILPIADDSLPWIDHPIDLALFVSCAAANLYMNAIIASEILKLLRNSKRRKRSKAPTLKRASIQAICTYTIGVTIFVVDNLGASLKAVPFWIIGTIYYVLAIGIPIGYLLWVCFRIYWEGLLGDVRTKAGKRLTVLMRYFTRIIVVYICIWLPASIIYISQFSGSGKKGLYYYVACVLYAMAAWANFALSLTKPDVRKNFIVLFTGQVCLPEDPPEERKKPRTFDSNSNGNKSREDQRTTSTGEESLGVKPPEHEPDPETAEVSPSPRPSASPAEDKDKDSIPSDSDHAKRTNGSEYHGNDKEYDDDSSDDGNVFDFDGADAPVMRITKGNNVSMMAVFAEKARRFTPTGRFTVLAQRRPHQSMSNATDDRHLGSEGSLGNGLQVRSSVLYSSRHSTSRMSMERSSMSEPFELPSTMSPERSRRSVVKRPSWLTNSSRDSSDDPSKSSSAADGLEASEPKKPPSAIFEESSSRSSDDGEPPEAPSQKTTSTSSSRETIVSYRTATLDFFMDDEESGSMEFSDPSAVANVSPKARNRWIKELRKNIRDLGRLMKKPDVTEKEKSIYHQSMVLKMRALEVMSVSLASDSTYTTSPVGGTLSDDEDDSGYLTAIPSESAGRFSNSSSISDDVDVTDGYESVDGDLRMQNVQRLSERRSVEVNTSQRYSKIRWLEELRQNITDLEHRLKMEDLTEEERSLVNRAIESQELTLASIENIGKDRESVFIARPSMAAARLSAHSTNSNPQNVEHRNNSAFVRSSLEVIDDDSSVEEDT